MIIIVTCVEYSSQRAANIARRLENVAASWIEKKRLTTIDHIQLWNHCHPVTSFRSLRSFLSLSMVSLCSHNHLFQKSQSSSSSSLYHLFQKSELIPEFEHRLTDDTLLCVIFRLQASQRNLSCLLVRLKQSTLWGFLKINKHFVLWGGKLLESTL